MELNVKSLCWAVGHQNPQPSSQPRPCKDPKSRTNLPKTEPPNPQANHVTIRTPSPPSNRVDSRTLKP